MQIFRDIQSLRRGVASLRAGGGRVAMVPTMGALHAGHMRLVEEAKAYAAHVVVSIFVNPTQFAPNEDLSAYPRREEADIALLEAAGVAILWAPPVEAMYSEGFSTCIHVEGVSYGLDGQWRPGHFDGVATVVAKLFNQVRPDFACFGEKDFQQLAVIRRLVEDLDLGVEIIGVETQRDIDGLALSSRNVYLGENERAIATALPETLVMTGELILKGGDIADALFDAEQRLLAVGFDSVDYISLCDAETMKLVSTLDGPARLLAAARIGGTRLIDNIAVNP